MWRSRVAAPGGRSKRDYAPAAPWRPVGAREPFAGVGGVPERRLARLVKL
jgi:hypothetical protein